MDDKDLSEAIASVDRIRDKLLDIAETISAAIEKPPSTCAEPISFRPGEGATTLYRCVLQPGHLVDHVTYPISDEQHEHEHVVNVVKWPRACMSIALAEWPDKS